MNIFAEIGLTVIGVFVCLYAIVVATRCSGCTCCSPLTSRLDNFFKSLESAPAACFAER